MVADMKTTVMTGLGPQEYKPYAAKMIRTFDKHWPADVDFVAYVEEPIKIPRGELRSFTGVEDCFQFLTHFNGNQSVNGKKQNERWKAKERAQGYSWRFDAYKFGRVPLIVRDAAHRIADTMGAGILIWLDADTVTFRDIPEGWIQTILPPGFAVSYLGRRPKLPEIGCVFYRIPEALPFLDAWADLYVHRNSGKETFAPFEKLPQFHSAYTFDHVLNRTDDILFHDMTPGGRGHVWMESPLVKFIDHLKGLERKALGYSMEHPEAELVRNA